MLAVLRIDQFRSIVWYAEVRFSFFVWGIGLGLYLFVLVGCIGMLKFRLFVLVHCFGMFRSASCPGAMFLGCAFILEHCVGML